MPKYIKAYKQFIEFVKTVEQTNATDHEKKLANLILAHFDGVLEKGPQSGIRSKYLFELIQKHGNTTPSDITYPNLQDQQSGIEFEKLKTIVLENFRGFSTEESFNLNKQYTFVYGPNASGKSSLFEALEYSMLGFIQEAIDKNIPTEKYVKHYFNNGAPRVKLIGVTSAGVEEEVKPNSKYNFCFIEKSRIERFARISSNTDKVMEKQIANLFGLEEFNKFATDFNKEVDKYFQLEPLNEKSLAEKTANIAGRKKNIEDEKIKLEKQNAEKIRIIEGAGCKTAEEFEEIYVKAPEGKKTKSEEINESLRMPAPQLIAYKTIVELQKEISEARDDYETLTKTNQELISRKSELQFKNFFKSVLAIESLPWDACPLCNTPLNQVHTHPFKNANEKLKKLDEVIQLETKTDMLFSSLYNKVSAMDKSLASFNAALSTFGRNPVSFYSNTSIEKDVKETAELLKHYQETQDYFTSRITVIKEEENHIEAKNKEILAKIAKRTSLEVELKSLDEIKNAYNERRIQISTIEKHISDWQKEIDDFEKTNAALIKEVEIEKETIRINRLWEDGYKKLTCRLMEYRDRLPLDLVGELSESTCSIYNLINSFDKDYEKAGSIILPKETGEYIQITFENEPGKAFDALCVLSEGHLRCLGLAILVSKNIKEACPALIFDDVVNAIDTEHRSGINDFLFSYEPLRGKQVFLTTHDDFYFSHLTHKVSMENSEKLVQTYTFVINETNRNIIIDQTTRNLLLRAYTDHSKGNTKDSLKSCRQALENIGYELWRKLSKAQRISIGITEPGKKPELWDMINKLKSIISKDKENVYPEAVEKIEFLAKPENWPYLNVGTHFGDNEPVLDTVVAKKIIDKCSELDSIVKNKPGTSNQQVMVTSVSTPTFKMSSTGQMYFM